MRQLFALSLLLAIAPLPTQAAEAVGPVTLDRSSQFMFPSKAIGASLRIDVILPIRYAESKERFPVVYVTDSNYLLASAAGTQLAQATGHLPRVILVGVGYDVPSIADTAQIRAREFSPTCDKAYMEQTGLPAELCGGADRFIEFFAAELKPFIASNYRASEDATLVGYSFGGLFALYTLLSRNEVFDRYLIGSASIEWDNEYLLKQEAQYAKRHKDLAKRVYLSVGELEGEGTVPNNFRMYEQLKSRNYPNLRIELEILDDETHMTAVNSTVMRGLRSVFADD